jgi:hypothetical protein
MGVFVVGADVYVADFGTAGIDSSHVDGALVRVAPDGSQTLIETPLASPTSLWFDPTTSSFLMASYFQHVVMSRPFQGNAGSATTLIPKDHLGFPLGIATNDAAIFIMNNGDIQPDVVQQSIQRWLRPSLTSYSLFTDFPNGPTHLDIDANYLYWTEGVAGRVVRRPLDVPFGDGPSVEVITTGVPATIDRRMLPRHQEAGRSREESRHDVRGTSNARAAARRRRRKRGGA